MRAHTPAHQWPLRAAPIALALVLGLGLGPACGDDPKRPIGERCDSDEQCSSGLCVEQVCLDPGADDDGDQLTNGLEDLVGTSPSHADTDGDGARDDLELGPNAAPLDADADGLIDALESLTADADGDCIPDQVDVQNAVPDPTGCGVVTDARADCAEWRAEDRASGPSLIDPDGDGPATAFEVDCDQATERGGWTPLVAAFRPYTELAPHAYLFVKDGAWARSPIVSGGWRWDAVRSAPGTWIFQLDGQMPTFACPGDAPLMGIGIGCARGDGGAIRVDSAGAAPAAGTVRLCHDQGVGPWVDSCIDGVKVYARRATCVPPAGQVVGGGTFEDFAADPCWEATLGFVTLTNDPDDRPTNLTGASLAITPNGASGWGVDLAQPHLTLLPGHAYRFGVWVRADGPVTGAFMVDGADRLVAGDDLRPDATWRFYERGFVARTFEPDARLSLVFGSDAAGGEVHLDDLVLEDLGAGLCDPGEAGPTADRGFDARLACWTLEDADRSPVWLSISDVPNLPEGLASPVLEVLRPGDDGLEPSYLVQEPIRLTADRWYRMGAWFEAPTTGAVRVVVGTPGTTLVDLEHALHQDGWQRVEQDFVLPPGEATTAEGYFHVKVQPAPGGVVRVDDLGIVDLGPSPCVAGGADLVRDGGFAGGGLCWERSANPPGAASFGPDSADVPPGGAAPSLHFSGASADVVEAWDVQLFERGLAIRLGAAYQLVFKARAAKDTSLVVLVHNWTDFKQSLYQVVNVPAGADWSTYVFDFTGAEDQADAVLELQLGHTGELWLDEVGIIEPAR